MSSTSRSNQVDKSIINYLKDKGMRFCQAKLTQIDDKISSSKLDQKINELCNEIIKDAYLKYNGYKIICVGYFVEKGDCPFFFDSNCLWDRKVDEVITLQHDNEKVHCVVCLFVISP